MRVAAVYRCRHCGEVYKAESYLADNLSVCYYTVRLYEGERVVPDFVRTAMVDIHTCDACVPRFGVADLVGWE